MTFHVCKLREAFITCCRLLTCLSSHVNNFPHVFGKNIASHLWLLMWEFIWTLSKPFLTYFASIWFLTCVTPHVDFQMASSYKTFTTCLATMWLLTSVTYSHVDFQVTITVTKHLPHVWQQYGFSPVCTLMWTFKWLLVTKHSPHVWQQCGFSPVCTLMWTFKLKLLTKHLPHVWQQYMVSHQCASSCGFSIHHYVQILSCIFCMNKVSHPCVFSDESSNYTYEQKFFHKCHIWKTFYLFEYES